MRLVKGGKQTDIVIQDIIKWLENQLVKANKTTLIIGVSGGVDSAVTSALCSRTHRRVICLTLPINQNPKETDRGMEHIKELQQEYENVEHKHIDLTSTYNQFCKDFGCDNKPTTDHYKLSLANSKARLRMTTLYMTSGTENGLVVGTGNKIEDFGVGFFTKYGDGGVDISPIADLMKSEIYQLGKQLNISKAIMDAPPTDGLWDDGRSDEFQLGATYEELEWFMDNEHCEEEWWNERENEVSEIYLDIRDKNLHKMGPIPVFKKDEENL